MNIAKRILGILTEPVKFFDYAAKKEKGLKTAFWYYAAITLIGTVLGTIIAFLYPTYGVDLVTKAFGLELPAQQLPSPATLVVLAIVGYLIGLVGSFIGAALLHAWCLIFGGKGNYAHSYQLLAYSSTAKMVLGWIPFVNLFTWIWSLILLIVGTEKLHKVTRRKATFMYLIPAALTIILVIVVMIFAATALQNLPAEVMLPA